MAQQVISKYIDERHKNWHLVLPLAMHAYNTAVHYTTKPSPFFMLFDRDATMPVDINLPQISDPLHTDLS